MSIRISKYMNNKLVRVEIRGLTLWFSYETIVALIYKAELYIIENYWSNTTGRHLNFIDEDKSIRLDSSEFNFELDRIFKELNL